jgi:DNA polymerase-1
MFGVPVKGMPSDVRARAKAINFGIVYGISEFGLARQLKIGVNEAADYIDLYFERFPGILDYMDECRTFARKNGYVETIFGRRVYTPDINSRDNKKRGRAERLSVNGPIQGSAADVLRMAMVHVVEKLEQHPKWGAKLLLQVHDELIVEAKEKSATEACRMLEHEMIHAVDDLVQWRVPIVVDAHAGRTWKMAKEVGT